MGGGVDALPVATNETVLFFALGTKPIFDAKPDVSLPLGVARTGGRADGLESTDIGREPGADRTGERER